ncbi:MAG: hypothetical protein M1365_08945 [Actinobacteria bacterium]|nr:hypothetical protein [Actinomycetota bacterium]
MKRYLIIFLFATTAVNIIFLSWFLINGDLLFYTDIARDFLLFQEAAGKKLVLIGPRSSVGGLFHGPLWIYLNLPAFLLSGGNPLGVELFWVLLIIVFLFFSFIVSKKLFGTIPAYFYIALLSGFLVEQTKGLNNPHGAFFTMPFFFFFLVSYLKTKKILNLLISIFLLGIITQFQIAVGIPLGILTFLLLLYFILKNKLWIHFSAFLTIIIPLSTFIIFDLRHNFLLFNAAVKFVLFSKTNPIYTNFLSLVFDRLKIMSGNAFSLFLHDTFYLNTFAFILTITLIILELKKKKNTINYSLFLYFYLGYFITTLINRGGPVLLQYYIPFIPLVFLITSSLVNTKYKKIAYLFLIIIVVWNLRSNYLYVKNSEGFFGNNRESWKLHSEVAKKLFSEKEKDFGYFIYSPDSLAYQEKYALLYQSKLSDKNAELLKKKPITFLIVEPPPPDNPYMLENWWIRNKLKITKEPIEITTLSAGFKILKYELTEEEIQMPFEKDIDTGIFFR